MREKLIEILETVAYPEVLCDGEVLVSTSRVADHLIANGVTIPVRCCDCVSCKVILDNDCAAHYYCKKRYGLPEVDPTDYCSKGERREGECI